MMNERAAWALAEESEECAEARDVVINDALEEHADCPHKTIEDLEVEGPLGGIRVSWWCGGCGEHVVHQEPSDD